MNNDSRKKQSRALRENAAEMAYTRVHPEHISNGEEQKFRDKNNKPSHIASFTKGLPHDPVTGLILSSADFEQFVLGIQSGTAANFKATPLGPAIPSNQPSGTSQPIITSELYRDSPAPESPCVKGKKKPNCNPDCSEKSPSPCNHMTKEVKPPRVHVWESCIAKNMRGSDGDCGADIRAWESQAAGNLFDLQGPDSQSVTMPPVPTLHSDELAAELAEVYAQGLLRDVHFSNFRDPEYGYVHNTTKDCKPCISVDTTIDALKTMTWFNKNCCDLSQDEQKRHRQPFTPQTLFRGQGEGVEKGPYLSQFLLLGNKGLGGQQSMTDGQISYGAVRIDQRVRVAEPCKDYMTTFESWVDVQNGANLIGADDEHYVKAPKNKRYRFITTPRDLATYVHHDALYESYLNACLILLGMKAPFDPGLPFDAEDVHDHQQNFASFGGPHLLTLVTEVATRALKAVRYQKFNTHRRARPEALAGLIDRYMEFDKNKACCIPVAIRPIKPLIDNLKLSGLLDNVKMHNKKQNAKGDSQKDASAKGDRYLLPMAFPEGSPMHPSYGAGHATVAGACITILKAFFDHAWELPLFDKECNPIAYEACDDGSALHEVSLNGERITIEGELNKLAANISIGRDWAGVHFYTDYIESLRMGEQIAISLLQEQRLCYEENFTMTIPLFDGGAVRI